MRPHAVGKNRKNQFIELVLCASLFALCVCAEAQQPAKVPRIAFLTNNFRSTFPAGDEAFRRGLRELGYVEGKNIIIEWRYAEGKFDRLTTLADELVALKVEAIVTGGPATCWLGNDSESAIPIHSVRGKAAAIQRKSPVRFQLFSQDDQSGVGEIHRYIAVSFH